MILLLDILHWLINLVYNFYVFMTVKSLLPVRKQLPLQVLAFAGLLPISTIVIYLQDPVNIVGGAIGFFMYVLVFVKGDAISKISTVTIIYPLIVVLNYMCLNSGRIIWYTCLDHLAENGGVLSSIVYTVSYLPRLFLWFGLWRFCKKQMNGIPDLLNRKMWLVLLSIGTAVFICILTVMSYLPDTPELHGANLVAYAISLAGIVTILGCFYLVVYMANAIRTDAQLNNLQMEYQYYEDRLKEEERVRAVYHDLKNHLLVLQAESGSQKMAASILSQIADYENYYQTGNAFLDIIVRDKAEKARQHEIDFSAMLHFGDGGFIDPLDISTIFGNAFDNAIEASRKLPVSRRLITAKANHVHGTLTIVIENNAAPVASIKPDQLLHGFGLKNIRQAVTKYHGHCTDQRTDGRFTLAIIIPLP